MCGGGGFFFKYRKYLSCYSAKKIEANDENSFDAKLLYFYGVDIPHTHKASTKSIVRMLNKLTKQHPVTFSYTSILFFMTK